NADEPKLLRVCADPDNLPFSDKEGGGCENRIATLVAEDLGMQVQYFYWPHRRGFMRSTIRAKECDVLMGIPKGMDGFLVTRPYYRSSYQFVSRVDRDLDITSLDDPRLKKLKIGVHTIGYDYNNSPAARSLGARGIVGLTGYSTFYTDENRPDAIIAGLAEDKIDLAIVWGPIAGYFGKQPPVPLSLAPLPDVDQSTRPTFRRQPRGKDSLPCSRPRPRDTGLTSSSPRPTSTRDGSGSTSIASAATGSTPWARTSLRTCASPSPPRVSSPTTCSSRRSS